jgi:hypothetical protein
MSEAATQNDVWELLRVRRRAARIAPAIEPGEAWDALQQPVHPVRAQPGYHLLRAALDTGWRIEEPVYLRPRWSDDGPRLYHFILRRPDAPPRLLSVPQSQEVDRFVRDEGLHVSTARHGR